jgi:F0F1-type ATP synthase epsilon subunit
MIPEYKETDEGIYITGGYTEALEQNEANVYAIVAEFLTNEELESAKKGRTLKAIPLGMLPLKKVSVR